MTLDSQKPERPLPPVFVVEDQYKRLMDLASGAMKSLPDVADELMDEIERASILAPAQVPDDVVTIGARVRFRVHGEAGVQTIYLVYPEDADISARRVSVLTPIGAALIGLRTGQGMCWETRTGAKRCFTITGVDQDPAAGVDQE